MFVNLHTHLNQYATNGIDVIANFAWAPMQEHLASSNISILFLPPLGCRC